MIYILEDNDERITQFRRVCAAIAPDVPVRFWRSAHAMMSDLVDGQSSRLITISTKLQTIRPIREPDTM